MLHEQPIQSSPKKPHEVFGLTEQEHFDWRVSNNRFMEIIDNEHTTIHTIKESSNNYGEFLFVTVSRAAEQGQIGMTFYGLGFHEYRERWFTDEWFWHQANTVPDMLQQQIPKEESEKLLKQRLESIAPHIQTDTQTERGRLFEILADLTDEDGALAEIEDLDYVTNLLNSEPDEEPPTGENLLDNEDDPKPLFDLGQLVGTPGALQALEEAEQHPFELIHRHVAGDWGELDEEDKRENDLSVEQGFRIISAYTLNTGVKVWVITEWDRSATTILLPSEY